MPDIRWIKLTTEMFDDEKVRIIESMPEADTILVLWIRLICMAGKTNDGGNIYLTPEIPYTTEQLAAIFNRPHNTVKLALEVFTRLKMVTLQENGVLFLPAFERHQNIVGMDKIREDTRKRVAAFRAKSKLPMLLTDGVTLGNVTVTHKNRIDKIRIEENKNIKESIKKNTYGQFENVLLTDVEFEKLKTQFNSSLQEKIEELSTGIASKGYKYKSHYATILNWARKHEKENGGNHGTNQGYSKGKGTHLIDRDKYTEPPFDPGLAALVAEEDARASGSGT